MATRAANDILEITKRVFGITRSLLLYRLIQLLFLPFIAGHFLLRLWRNRAYRPHFAERLGFLPQPFTRTRTGAIWLHAVSVGEVASALPLIRLLREDQPSIPVYLSTSTVAGRKAALRQASALVDATFYAPIDFASCVRRTLRVIRPALVIVLETEIWPNLYGETKRAGARLAVVNARISDRTWPRYHAFRKFFCPVLQLPDLVLAQSPTDRARFAEMGVPAQRLSVARNLKYDASLHPRRSIALPTLGADRIWIAASTVGPKERGSLTHHSIDEDDVVIKAFGELSRKFPRLLLILAPRQEARFTEVAHRLERAGIRFLRRSESKDHASPRLALPGVLLLDTIGELAGVYGVADVSFIGGSLAPRGGHNILEAIGAGSPVIIGPHMQNFESIARDFRQGHALVQIQRGDDLSGAVATLLEDPAAARELANRAHGLLDEHKGGAREMADYLWPLYFSGSPRKHRPISSRVVLAPLAALWTAGGCWMRQRSERHAAGLPKLDVPVVSIGGITLGGSGKTPFTKYLASSLIRRGYSPAILTRGYRRRSPAPYIVLEPGAKMPPALTGDEAQIFLRSGVAPIGIGANRYQVAYHVRRQFPATNVLLLDDGYQHARLARDFDVLVIDGLDPFGGEDVVPMGRLREPLSALSRADVFIVTRAQDDVRFRSICQRLSEFNARALVFRTRLIARSWRDYRTNAILPDLAGRRVAAFCGLGNPENFWQTLESLDLEVVFRWSFPDHHAYSPTELQRVALQARLHGAEIIVTTEKDRINCPLKLDDIIAPLALAWLEIDVELENEPAFFSLLEQTLQRTRTARFAS